jgi:hypothetical protein
LADAAERPATAEDCAILALTAPGAPCSAGTTPYDPSSPFTGDEVGKATAFLLERNGSGTRGVVRGCYQYRPGIDKDPDKPQADRILKLNPQFRVGLYKSLSEIEKQYGGKNIVQSGYRCDDSDGNHPRGCAVDIIWTSCQRNWSGFKDPWRCSSDGYDARTNSWHTAEQKWIDANGKKAPYNVHIRIRKAPEGHHVEPVNTQGCVTGATVGSNGQSASPTSGFANAIRQALGVRQQPVQPPSPPSQPLATSQPLMTAFDQPKPVETPDLGVPAMASSSVADKLAELIKETSVASTATTTSVPLIIDPRDSATIQSNKESPSGSATAGIGGSITQSTFAGEDASWQSANQQASGLSVILANIATTLRRLLQLIQPFDGVHLHEPEFDS